MIIKQLFAACHFPSRRCKSVKFIARCSTQKLIISILRAVMQRIK